MARCLLNYLRVKRIHLNTVGLILIGIYRDDKFSKARHFKNLFLKISLNKISVITFSRLGKPFASSASSLEDTKHILHWAFFSEDQTWEARKKGCKAIKTNLVRVKRRILEKYFEANQL